MLLYRATWFTAALILLAAVCSFAWPHSSGQGIVAANLDQDASHNSS